MQNQVVHIKNMVCNRCIKVVKDELELLGIHVLDVKLGEATVVDLHEADIIKIKAALENNGFELIDNKKSKVIEKIKIAVIELIHQNQPNININYSFY